MRTKGDGTLPAAVDAQSPLTREELAVLRSQYETEGSKGWVTTQCVAR